VNPSPPRRRRRRILAGLLVAVLVIVAVGTWFALREMRTSIWQARYLAPRAAEISWWMEAGPADSLLPPARGPYDLRMGYTDLEDRVAMATERGFAVVEQARSSDRLHSLVGEHGLFPVYREKDQGGLTILDRDGEFLFRHRTPDRVWTAFEEIPPVVWQTLLYIENRTALDPDSPFRNPAVEWGRLLRSTAELGLRAMGREGSVAGASTLATQIEKYRHAPEGLTASPGDKLRQMATASFRAYADGEETLEARRQIVLHYVNSVPLAAIRGEGEIAGIPDGLWAWYGTDPEAASAALFGIPTRRVGVIPAPEEVSPYRWRPTPEMGPVERVEAQESPEGAGSAEGARSLTVARTAADGVLREDATEGESRLVTSARVYRQVLSLFLAQRRPSYYLASSEGREALARLTDRYLDLLAADGLIEPELARAARETRVDPRILPPERPPVDFVERKAVNTVRTGLLTLLGVPRLYDLDRVDMMARTTIDAGAQARATQLFRDLRDPSFIAARGFDQFRLLDRGDPAEVVYSVSLHERTPMGNVVRIQADNLDAPFNLNESARLELGSTAKLRTLASYLEILAELHDRFGAMPTDSVRAFPIASQDRLSLWARDRRLTHPGESTEDALRAAMNRTFSASPAERFVTGGGVQTFSNFDNTYDHQSLTVTAAFRHSVNLPFVRMMREVVNHYMLRVPGSTAFVLQERDTPLRQEYLARFADREGIQFLNQFIPKYRGKTRVEILQALFGDRRLSPQRMAWAYITAVPGPTVEEFELVLRQNLPDAQFSDAAIADIYRRADPTPHDLADLGYLASVHPLELWAARFFIENPGAGGADAIRGSEEARQEVYRWLFRTSRVGAQDQRIRSLLEVEAFTEIHRGWQRLGYPFGNIVPSLGTSIGSSGDRPAALNELVGIILNGGVRLPTFRVEELHFAQGTPWETRLLRQGAEGTRVMDPAVARILREAMVDVVEEGTARRMRGVLRDTDGTPLVVGGKTGTGDNRFRVYAPGGRLLESRSVNRTSTFVFFIGDRYYGVISAYVPGDQADAYRFTSALPTQILRELGSTVEALMAEDLAEAEAEAAGEEGVPRPGIAPAAPETATGLESARVPAPGGP
jgi:membrane peptidoglycan carboxypeptidase